MSNQTTVTPILMITGMAIIAYLLVLTLVGVWKSRKAIMWDLAGDYAVGSLVLLATDGSFNIALRYGMTRAYVLTLIGVFVVVFVLWTRDRRSHN